MTLVRWNPMREMAAMQNVFDRMFDDTWRTVRGAANGTTALSLDVYETDTAYTIYAVLPGATQDHIQISLHDGVLTINGEVPQQSVEGARALMLERSYGKFTRSLRLPQAIDLNKVEATFADGVLTLNLPKAEEAQPRIIPVKGAPTTISQN